MVKRILVPVHLGQGVERRQVSLSLGFLLPVVALARAAAAIERVKAAIFSYRGGTRRESGECGFLGEGGCWWERVGCLCGWLWMYCGDCVGCSCEGLWCYVVWCGDVCIDVNEREILTMRNSLYLCSSV